MTHLNFIVAAALAMASPAWACVIGESGWLDKCDKEFSTEHPVNIPCPPNMVLVGDKCVTMTDVDDAPHIQIPIIGSFERAPNAIYTVNGPGICLAGNTVWAAKNGKCEPLSEPGPTLKCSDGYTALTYGGTWHWVCARDVREPQ